MCVYVKTLISFGMASNSGEDLRILADVNMVLTYIPFTSAESIIVPEPINKGFPPTQ